MQSSDYLFAIQNDKFLFYGLDNNGKLTLSTTPYFLNYAPDGWQDITIENIRNTKYWGIDRKVTVPLSYINDGAVILKSILYTIGIEAPAYLSISRQELDYSKGVNGTLIMGGHPKGADSQYRQVAKISGVAGKIYVKVELHTAIGSGATLQVTCTDPQNTQSFFSGNKLTQIFEFDCPIAASIGTYIYDPTGIAYVSFTLCNIDGSISGAYGFWYKQIYRSEIDLSTFTHADAKVTCTTLEDGLSKYLKSNEATVYELPLNVADAIAIKMDGVGLLSTATITTLSILASNGNNGGNNGHKNLSTVPITIGVSDGESYGLEIKSQTLQYVTDDETQIYSYLSTSDNCLVRNNGAIAATVSISGNFDFFNQYTDFNIETPEWVRFYFMTSDLKTYQIGNDIYLNNSSTAKSIKFNFRFPLNPYQSLFIFCYFGNDDGNGSAKGAHIQYLETSVINIKAISRSTPTFIKAFTAQYIFDQLIYKVTENNYNADVSPYLLANKNIVFTSGNGIRGLTKTSILGSFDATIKISLADFYKFWDSYDSVGMGEVDGVVLFNKKENLIDKANIIDLVEPSKFKLDIAKEYLFNELEIGYPEIKNDVGVLNGNQEFNCKYLFSTGTMKVAAKIDKVSKIKASCYEIEKIRTSTLSSDTTDYKDDNDNFVLVIGDLFPAVASADAVTTTDDDGNTIITSPAVIGSPAYYGLDRSLNASITAGLIDPSTVFNIALSPKRMIMNNGDFLRSCLYKADDKILGYKSADRNTAMVCNGLAEKADIPVSSLGTKFFYPLYFNFDIPSDNNLIDLLNINPLQLFRFPFNGASYTGVAVKVSIAPSSQKAQTYQLLAMPENDLSTLINFYGQ